LPQFVKTSSLAVGDLAKVKILALTLCHDAMHNIHLTPPSAVPARFSSVDPHYRR
jgi:hypothetical protein